MKPDENNPEIYERSGTGQTATAGPKNKRNPRQQPQPQQARNGPPKVMVQKAYFVPGGLVIQGMERLSDCPELYKICLLFSLSEGGAAVRLRLLPGVAPRRGARAAAGLLLNVGEARSERRRQQEQRSSGGRPEGPPDGKEQSKVEG